LGRELAIGLLELRGQLLADGELADSVRRKYAIRNTHGYRLCALLDGETPLEIFRRFLVGSEGTLAFVAEAVINTVPLPSMTRCPRHGETVITHGASTLRR
jgi:D-lactate dehydrogenase